MKWVYRTVKLLATGHEIYGGLERSGDLGINNDSAYPFLLMGEVMGGNKIRINGLGVTGSVEWTTDQLSSNWFSSGVTYTANTSSDEIEATFGNVDRQPALPQVEVEQ